MHIANLKDHPELIQQLAEWHQTEWGYLNPGSDLKMRLRKMQRYMGDQCIPSTWVVLDADDRCLASTAVIEHDMDTRLDLTPWIASVYVDEKQRGRGIGSTLMEHVMEQLREAGSERIYLFRLLDVSCGCCTVGCSVFQLL